MCVRACVCVCFCFFNEINIIYILNTLHIHTHCRFRLVPSIFGNNNDYCVECNSVLFKNSKTEKINDL